MNAEQVLENIMRLVASLEKEKEEAECKCEKLKKQAESEHEAKKIYELYDKVFWERSKECTLENVIFQLKLELVNYNRSN